ncbi:unnamed protein product [Cylicostephanus goldi]|uniref:Peptidase M1 membrane alanine aminopeptidase domain-containing protein n=1 Tax=Cylicostephanus goldi TaxID=71465 RepID=A0A3P6RLQ5_CYLGO|nr:unnamed protein product [Cylicostephanus goldi]
MPCLQREIYIDTKIYIQTGLLNYFYHVVFQHYIRKHAYNNAEAADLWAALNEVVGSIHGSPDDMKVGDFADQWTAQMGFPLVTVESFNETHVKLTQERYRKNQNAKDPEKYANPKYGFKWDVPIWYQEGDSSVQLSWLKREEPLYLQLNKPEHFIVINAGRNGFYRQNYDAVGWQKITKQLKDNHQVGLNVNTQSTLLPDRKNPETFIP